ncbi:MAG: substrate-binding domain-containing protein [Alphaproteobacteria bacterium]|jgi:DNA-binding LacI/PurR family transcriptional regulator|nr:substrate-binding domain-containing protein [Alphaproteobacteria bacterium]
MARSPVTSVDVARLAEVSQSAVSRTFTPGASVSPETRAKVLAAAAKLGYRPNAIARTLITRRSRIVGLVVGYLDNQFYPVVIEGLAKRLREEGYHVLLFMAEAGRADAMLPEILQYQVDAIVMASATLSSPLARECANTGIPVLLFNRFIPGLPTSSVTSDNREGGRQVARFLADGGHRRIGFIAGAADSSTNLDREAGFLDGLAERGLACAARAVGNYSFVDAAAAARALFAGPERPDAVFVANDHMAIAVMDILRFELGLSVPGDVSVVGYDNVPQAAWRSYDLTTVEQPAKAMIEATVATLVGQIGRRPIHADSTVVPGRLVIRGSARVPEGHAREAAATPEIR